MSDAFALEFEGPSGEHLDFGWDTERLEQLDGELGAQTPVAARRRARLG